MKQCRKGYYSEADAEDCLPTDDGSYTADNAGT